MAFLDNSGDIILDAVLTDLGRKRMAEGNFKITQFALGDDEVDYHLWDESQEPNLRGRIIENLPVVEPLLGTTTGHLLVEYRST